MTLAGTVLWEGVWLQWSLIAISLQRKLNKNSGVELNHRKHAVAAPATQRLTRLWAAALTTELPEQNRQARASCPHLRRWLAILRRIPFSAVETSTQKKRIPNNEDQSK